jgi:dipeptidyl aminopeptidase/acylaminoacyl peptidase
LTRWALRGLARSAIVAALLAVIGSIAQLSAATSHASCPAALAGAAELGTLAFIRDGDLIALDVASCRTRRLIARGPIRGPVGWSGDGRWIADGATVVAARGGPALKPLPGVDGGTAWSPQGHVLAGVNKRGGVLVGGPGLSARRLFPDGWGATALAFSPTGRLLAVSRSLFPKGAPPYHQEIWLVDWRSGRARELFRVRKPNLAPPLLFGFSPDGRWLIAWQVTQNSSSLMADGLPLVAIRIADGKTVAIGTGTLVYRDFLSWCGSALAYVVNRGGRQVTLGDRIALAGPPTWTPTVIRGRIHNRNSYNSPSCSPPGQFEIAAAVGPKTDDSPFGREHRRIWLVGYTGGNWHPLAPAPPPRASDELPRWSADGRWIAFIRTTPTSKDGVWHGRLYLLDLGKQFNGRASLVGPVADLGSTGNYYGHYQWDDQLAWRTHT